MAAVFGGMTYSGLVGDLAGRGTTRAEDAQGTPNQSHISPSILAYKDQHESFASTIHDFELRSAMIAET